MLVKIHTAYVQDSEICFLMTVPGGFLVRFLTDQADLFVRCPEDRIEAARAAIDARLAGPADDAPRPDDAPPAGDPGGDGPEGPKPPRGGYF